MIEEKNIRLLEDFGVLSRTEVFSRYEIKLENYNKILHIEALTMARMARRQLIPAAMHCMEQMADTVNAKRQAMASLSCRTELRLLEKLSEATDAMSDGVLNLEHQIEAAETMEDTLAKAQFYHDEILVAMDSLRTAADTAESICGEDYWPIPSYTQILYYV